MPLNTWKDVGTHINERPSDFTRSTVKQNIYTQQTFQCLALNDAHTLNFTNRRYVQKQCKENLYPYGIKCYLHQKYVDDLPIRLTAYTTVEPLPIPNFWWSYKKVCYKSTDNRFLIIKGHCIKMSTARPPSNKPNLLHYSSSYYGVSIARGTKYFVQNFEILPSRGHAPLFPHRYGPECTLSHIYHILKSHKSKHKL